MIYDYRDYTCAFFAFELESQVKFILGAIEAADDIRRILKAKSVLQAPNVVLLQDLDRQLLVHISSQKVFFQTMGGGPWSDSLPLMQELVSAIVKHIQGGSGVDRDSLKYSVISRAGFRTITYVPLKMSHPELVAATFSAYLRDRETLQQSFGALDDVLVQLYGIRSGRRFRVQIAPQDKNDSSKNFFSLGNLDFFVENRFLDLRVKEFHDRISGDCLNVDIDCSQDKLLPNALGGFLMGAVADAEQLRHTAINLARAIPVNEP